MRVCLRGSVGQHQNLEGTGLAGCLPGGFSAPSPALFLLPPYWRRLEAVSQGSGAAAAHPEVAEQNRVSQPQHLGILLLQGQRRGIKTWSEVWS